MPTITILNLKCNNPECGTSIGQAVISADSEEVKCPVCGSQDCTYSTLLK